MTTKPAAVIEVDQTNYAQAKPVVANAIKNATFIAFDCEFTGLHRERQQGVNVLLPAKSRYAHLRQTMFGGGFMLGRCSGCGTEQLEAANFCHHCGAKRKLEDKSAAAAERTSTMRRQEFLIAQVGIACYIYQEDRKKYDVKSFSFYISPRPWSSSTSGSNVKVENDLKFSCLGSSLKFLGDHAFDFNRWIKEGIPFMSRSQYLTEKDKVKQRGQYSSIKDLEVAKGFLDVWDMLLTANKPLVGHQCFLDLLYLWHQLEQPLPKDLTEVLKQISTKVSVLVDTKHLLTWYPRDLGSLFEREAVTLRQKKLDRLKADLAEKERQRKETKEKQLQQVEGQDPPSRVLTPTPDGQSSPGGDERKDVAVDREKSILEQKSDLLRQASEMADEIRANVCQNLQRSILEGDELGNKFRSMHLQDIFKLLFPILKDLIPSSASREHDAGYDAYMTGAVFLGMYLLIQGENAPPPTTRVLQDQHMFKKTRKAEPGSPYSFAFVNRIFIFAAPYHLDISAATLPPLDETHSTTYTIRGEGANGHVDAARVQAEVRKVDQFAELYWVEFQKKGVIVLFRRDCPPSELYKKLSEGLAPLQISPAVTAVKQSLLRQQQVGLSGVSTMGNLTYTRNDAGGIIASGAKHLAVKQLVAAQSSSGTGSPATLPSTTSPTNAEKADKPNSPPSASVSVTALEKLKSQLKRKVSSRAAMRPPTSSPHKKAAAGASAPATRKVPRSPTTRPQNPVVTPASTAPLNSAADDANRRTLKRPLEPATASVPLAPADSTAAPATVEAESPSPTISPTTPEPPATKRKVG
ncbi:hypothetical protein DIPPA_07817 [Diplonema papillatum]|nr:hypothetical protein DIPPA_07817 [Diplonema papillatum]